MVLKIGITGGIGSGKTIVCKIFGLLQVPIFVADQVAKELLDTDSEIKEKLIHLFGPDVYKADGNANRKKLASIIFNDDLSLQKANKIIHPVVKEKFLDWVAKQDSPYVLHEAAILFESGFYKLMDYNILISADKEIRIKRVMERDNVSREKVLLRIKKQWDDHKKAELADTVILNNNELLIPKVLDIHKKLKEYGKVW
jgi:dephospho-CoA kinase